MNKCQVCEKHKNLQGLPGGKIFEDELVFVGHFPVAEEPAHFGHIILELKRHITQINEMTEPEAIAIGVWTRRIAMALHDALEAEHVYTVRIGDVTPHLHFHLVPRYKNAPRDTWGALHFRWAEGPKATPQDMKVISQKIRDYCERF